VGDRGVEAVGVGDADCAIGKLRQMAEVIGGEGWSTLELCVLLPN
jgi:hypothetical protein